jgi:uncharacterized protein YhaN
MRIERLEIGGFGRFADVAWKLEPGLTVMLGENEAGKTTLLNALRAILFGFESSRDGRAWYPALAGGRRGGRLSLLTESGDRWTVERYGPRGGAGSLAVRAPSGNQGGQETLDRLMHGADRDLFNAIFAFGLGELQDFETLGGDGVRGRIYGAAAGLGGSSAVDLERQLREQQEAIFRPSGRLQPMNQLFGRMDELHARILELSRQPQEFEAAHRDHADAREAAAGERTTALELRARALHLQRVLDAAPMAAELDELERRLVDTEPTLDALAPDAIEVLDRRLAALAEERARLEALDEQLAEIAVADAGLTVDEPLLEAADEIRALDADRRTHASHAEGLREASAAEARHAATVAEQLAHAGGWDEERLLGLDDSIVAVAATREHETGLATARASAAAAERSHASAEQDLASREGEDPVRGAIEPEDVDASAALRELQLLRARGPLASPALPADLRRLAAGGTLALGLLAAGAAAGTWLGQPVMGVLIGILAAALLLVLVRPSANAGAFDEAPLLDRAGLAPGATDADVARRLDELAEARARRSMARDASGRLAARREEVARLADAAAAAAAAAREVEDAWRGWVGGHGLPSDCSPEVARQLLAAAGIARRAATERDAQRRIVAGIEAERDALAVRAEVLLRRLEVPGDGSIDGRLASVVERLERAIADRRARQEMATRRASILERRVPLEPSVDALEASVADHLAATGAGDTDELRARAATAAERRELQRVVRERHIGLGGIAGGADAVETLRAELRGRDLSSVEAELARVSAEADVHEAEERRLLALAGELDARIRALESADELGALRQELAILEGRAAGMATDWAVRAIAGRLLAETRARYERERQPDVVRAAETHFDRITGGRYARIIAPPGEAGVRVETESGEAKGTDELSRGTAEQLYLAIRFGLIEEFARHAEALPVVMDDILVNFDADRAGRAAAAIRDLAARHQILYFTCHRWTAELLDPGGDRTLTLG